VGLEETCRIALCGLVGRLSYAYLVTESFTIWMERTWIPVLGYKLELHFLTKGWMGFVFKSLEDATLLLNNPWVLGGCSLMLKRWTVAFDPLT